MIPYQTFPELGFESLHTFGLMLALGVFVGGWVGKRHLDRCGYEASAFWDFAIWTAVAGVAGARLVWIVSHLGEVIGDPLATVALWRGGLSLMGGFLAVACIAPIWLKRNPEIATRDFFDAATLGLVVGLAIGRVGCVSVGEHLGGESTWLLSVRLVGGETIEPAAVGESFHNVALYELMFLVVLIGVLYWFRRLGWAPGMLTATAGLIYSVGRFSLDMLRINDMRFLGLTGAQYVMIGLFAVSFWYLFRVRRGAPAEPAQPDRSQAVVAGR